LVITALSQHAAERCPNLPVITFEIKIELSAGVIIDRTGWLIPVLVFCPIPMGRGMGRRATLFMIFHGLRLVRI